MDYNYQGLASINNHLLIHCYDLYIYPIILEEMKDILKNREFLEHMFDSIHKEITPDFTKEDWIQLMEKSSEGDMTSYDLLVSLWHSKVEPRIPREY